MGCYCSKCGKKLTEDALYCSGCGEKVKRDDRVEVVNEHPDQGKAEKRKKHKAVLPCIIIGVVIIIAIVVIGMIFFLNMNKGEEQSGQEETLDLRLYDVTVDEINVYEENRQPNERDYSLEWDNTLFYFLEDVGPEETDGQIEYFDVTRRQLRNAENGNLIEYEIYTNPETEKIHKIVSIEQMDNSLEIIDYYYLDTGAVNFIYKRNDSVYTPTYATIDKTGERYYFNNDTLVKWRWIDVPRQVEQVVLQYDEANESYTQHLYNEISDSGKESFDTIERQMFNAAYNTYDAISGSADYGNVKGYVVDENGDPIEDAEIAVYAGTESIGELTTDDEGYYETGISFYEDGYRLEVSADGYETENVYQVVVEEDSITTWVDPVSLVADGEAEHQVEFVVYDGDTLVSDAEEKVIKIPVADAEVVIRRGLNNTTEEEVVYEGSCDEDGNLTVELKSGIYTAEITKKGYATIRQNLVVIDDRLIEIPMVAELEENQLKIVLTWEGESDLDSCLFTPDKSSNGDMAYINAINTADEAGNQLNYDSKSGQGAEVIYIADITKGTYKYYVSDYKNCLDGNLDAADMLSMNIQVAIYDKDGLVTSYTMPRNLSGVVWEVFEVKNGNVITLQHSYTNLEGKNWWSADKEMLDIEACVELRQVMENLVSWGWYVKGETESAVDIIIENPQELFDFVLCSINNGSELSCVPFCETPHAGDTGYGAGETSVELLNSIYNSLTGETYDYSTEVGKEYENGWYCWNEGYLLYMGADGDDWVDSLRNYSVMRNEDGLWEVTAEYWRCYENLETQEQKVMDVTFTLIKNPSSIFNGYSIIDMETNVVAEEYAAYASFYIELIRQYEEEYPNEYTYELIYVNDDEIPELLANGYYMSLYTYDSGMVYTLMDEWGYGGGTCPGYYPRKNVVEYLGTLDGGRINTYQYWYIDSNCEFKPYYDEILSMWEYKDKNNNGILDDEEISEIEYHYYYGTNELTEEEYEAYIFEGNYQELVGTQSATEIINELSKRFS